MNIPITGVGAIVLNSSSNPNDSTSIYGNWTFGAGQTIRGAGWIGGDNNGFVNQGLIDADVAGRNIEIASAISGDGTFRSEGGAGLIFDAPASGAYLISNGRLQLNGGSFTVATDYQNANFGSGNAFRPRSGVSGLGQILAADAHQVVYGAKLSGNVVDFGALRVGGSASTSILVGNTGTTILRGAVQSLNARNVAVTNPDFVLYGGGPLHSSGLTFYGTTSGVVSGQTIDVVNNFDNVADDHLTVQAHVYAPAVAYLSNTTVNFGVVRLGAAGVSAGAIIGNTASGSLTDSLRLGVVATPGGVSLVSAPSVLAAGEYGEAVFGLDTRTAGFVGGSTTIGFTSTDPELPDLALGSQTISFTGTVTDPAVAELVKLGGAGLFSGGGDHYTLNLGVLGRSGVVSTDIAVLNAVADSAFAETLAGGLKLSGDSGFSFAGDPFSGLAGGETSIGDWLSFDPRSLAEGDYRGVLTFNGSSHYPGLDDLALGPLQLTIIASVVPEPSSWVLMIVGLGGLGGALRTRARGSGGVPA